jgi:hypothetical protein
VGVHGGQAEAGAEHGSATGRQHEAGPTRLYKIGSQGMNLNLNKPLQIWKKGRAGREIK